MTSRTLLVFSLLTLSACGSRGRDARPGSDAAPDLQAVPATGDEPPPAAPRPVIEDQDSLDSADRRSYQQRLRSMDSYEGCMAKVAQVEQPLRGQLEAACKRQRQVTP
jgi:hypothetical protein